jgi:hypothetical protein
MEDTNRNKERERKKEGKIDRRKEKHTEGRKEMRENPFTYI